jgi:hypothetical protein
MLGALLADRPGRQAEAADAFRTAVEQDVRSAWCGLASVATGEERREARAMCWYEWWPG